MQMGDDGADWVDEAWENSELEPLEYRYIRMSEKRRRRRYFVGFPCYNYLAFK